MKLYICWGTFGTPRPGGHPCRNAYEALKGAGHQPQLVRTYGLGLLGPLNAVSPGRREVAQLSGNYVVPTLVLDDGTVIDDSKKIVAWAHANPAAAA